MGHFDRTDRDRNPNRAFVAPGVNAGRYPAAGHEFMIVAYLRMRKIARTERDRDRERGWTSKKGKERVREKEKECGCVTTLKKMPATRTKIKMITYPTADVRALRVTHTHM